MALPFSIVASTCGRHPGRPAGQSAWTSRLTALAARDACRKLKLTIDSGKATGSFPLKKGVTEVSLLHQAVSIYGDGKRVRSDNVTETVKVAVPVVAVAGNTPKPATANPGATNPGRTQPAVPPSGSSAARLALCSETRRRPREC